MSTHSDSFSPTSQVSHAGDSTQNNSSDSKPALALVSGSAPDFDAIGKWHQDRYAVFTNSEPISGGTIPKDKLISSLLRLEEWERTHPLEERTPRTLYSQEEWNAHTLSTQQALASLCDRECELRTSICENQQRIQSSLEYRRQLLGSIASNWVTMRLLLQSVFVTGVIYRTELRGRLMLCLFRLVMVLLSKRVSCFCSWVSSFFRRTSQVSHG